jgi:hypothetical protein
MEIEMRTWFPILTASAVILASSMGLAQAQQSSGGQMMQQHGQQDRQGGGMMGQAGPRSEMMGSGMGPGMMGRGGMMGGGMMGGGMMGGGGMMRIMLAVMDADGDGALSLEEVQEAHARIFNHVDADDDGRVTLEEMQAFFHGTAPAADSEE